MSARLLLSKQYIKTASWMLVILYEILSLCMLAVWGLSSVVGILAASFAILLPGIMLSPKAILPVSLLTFAMLAAIYALEKLHFINPHPYIPPEDSSLLDVLAYITILGIFALVSWISAKQATQSIARALKAEEQVRKQNASLSVNLATESAELRRLKQDKTEELFKFALIGQSTAATLHEIANHLSILNLDLVDIKDKHRNSKAIASAEHSIQKINTMVSEARSQLNTTSSERTDALKSLQTCFSDFLPKASEAGVACRKHLSIGSSKLYPRGSGQDIAQCITILLNNSLHAVQHSVRPKISLSAYCENAQLHVLVVDNGPGVPKAEIDTLFTPHESKKSSGLGVGLYIAKQIAESHLQGTLTHKVTTSGATFELAIPIATPSRQQSSSKKHPKSSRSHQ